MYRKLLFATVLLTFCLVVLGAYVRLSDAGLGCPDWPGCYGKLTPHLAAEHIEAAQATAPDGPVSLAKAWKEMVHRYLAAFIGLLIISIAILAWGKRKELGQSPWLATLLIGVVILQGLFGKWTVTLLLKPAIVTGHLIGGLLTLSLLLWLALRQVQWRAVAIPTTTRRLVRLGLVLVVMQIILGGWVSTNYAALVCTDLPTCQGSLVPKGMDFTHGFQIVRELGREADGDMLSMGALTAIHWSHRLGALVVATVLLILVNRLWRIPPMRGHALVLLFTLLLQFCLGLANVWFSLPLPVAAAHNGGAALLLLAMVALNYRIGIPDWQASQRRAFA